MIRMVGHWRRKLGALIGGSWFGAGFEAGMGNRRLKGFQASRAHLNSLIAAAGPDIKRGGFAKGSASALRSGNGLASVVMFILVPQVTLRKRLDVAAAAEKWADAVPGLVIRNWRDGA